MRRCFGPTKRDLNDGSNQDHKEAPQAARCYGVLLTVRTGIGSAHLSLLDPGTPTEAIGSAFVQCKVHDCQIHTPLEELSQCSPKRIIDLGFLVGRQLAFCRRTAASSNRQNTPLFRASLSKVGSMGFVKASASIVVVGIHLKTA